MIVKVCVDTKTSAVDKIFEYHVPLELRKNICAGVRCSVPFGNGNKRRVGFVLSISESGSETRNLKSIIEVLDEKPLLSRERLVEAYRIKNRYFCSFMDAIRLFLPVGAKTDIDEVYFPLNEPESFADETEKLVYLEILNLERAKYEILSKKFGSKLRGYLKNLENKNAIEREFSWRDKTESRYITVYSVPDKNIQADEISKKAPAQRRVLKVLSEVKFLNLPDLLMFASCSASTVSALVKKGAVVKTEIEKKRTPYKERGEGNKIISLTPLQNSVAKAVKNGKKEEIFLLRGVTGSGKTQVYISAIEEEIKKGKSAMVLVPEISLTHQLVNRFIEVFGERVALLHSKLSDGERYDEWMRIASGEASVIIGARSAVFAPSDNLGIIIIDEEHEDTYKSESGVRYDAREVAALRAKSCGAKVLLASATPRVEDYFRAKEGIYTLLEMDERFGDATLPETIIADMGQELKEGNRSPFSAILQEEIRKNLSNDEQSILFLNRRGHSTFVSCRSCGEAIKCPDCSISLTYHSFGDFLMCHYCGHKESMPKNCPQCQSEKIRGFGTGTQKIEEKIEEEFSGATILRMDVDTTGGKNSHEKILDSFQNDNIDILLGTQMVAKGLDFENVTLVGVLAADQVLNVGDYRAAEKTFDLIVQVCGRSGRGDKKGRSVIQTYSPENSTIKYAAKHDYKGFYEDEIKMRKILNYPPFCDIINLTVFGTNEEEVKKRILLLYNKINGAFAGENVTFYSPAPCLVDKIKNKYRWHFWFKCKYDRNISNKLGGIFEKENMAGIICDINPNFI